MSVFPAFTKRRRFHRLAAVLVAVAASSSAVVIGAAPADALTYHRWAIDANTVRVADAQEENRAGSPACQPPSASPGPRRGRTRPRGPSG